MRSSLLRLSVVILALGLIAAACSSNTTTPSSPATTAASESPTAQKSGTITINGEEANDHGTKDVSGKDETDLELDDFYFGPTVLKGTAGQQIKLDLENEGSTTHNFSLEAQNISQDVAPQEKQEVTVTFPQSGILEFFCRFHRTSGMIGELSV